MPDLSRSLFQEDSKGKVHIQISNDLYDHKDYHISKVRRYITTIYTMHWNQSSLRLVR